MRAFQGGTAVITGGASGIGLAVAQVLGRRGMRLVLADIEPGALDASVADLERAGVEAIGVPTDVRERAAVHALADAAWDRFGAVHLVMHNAGVVAFGPVWELTDADWDWSMQVNLQGVINGVQAFLPRMLKEGHEGHMLFTASFAGLVANRGLAAYNVTKAGVVALAESLDKDLRGTRIGASVLCPMRVESRIEESARNRPEQLGGPGANRSYTEEERQAMRDRRLSVGPVAELIVQAIERGDLYIHTHTEARPFVRRRFEKIDETFGHAL